MDAPDSMEMALAGSEDATNSDQNRYHDESMTKLHMDWVILQHFTNNSIENKILLASAQKIGSPVGGDVYLAYFFTILGGTPISILAGNVTKRTCGSIYYWHSNKSDKFNTLWKSMALKDYFTKFILYCEVILSTLPYPYLTLKYFSNLPLFVQISLAVPAFIGPLIVNKWALESFLSLITNTIRDILYNQTESHTIDPSEYLKKLTNESINFLSSTNNSNIDFLHKKLINTSTTGKFFVNMTIVALTLFSAVPQTYMSYDMISHKNTILLSFLVGITFVGVTSMNFWSILDLRSGIRGKNRPVLINASAMLRTHIEQISSALVNEIFQNSSHDRIDSPPDINGSYFQTVSVTPGLLTRSILLNNVEDDSNAEEVQMIHPP